ncbi:MAG: DNA-binding protein [Desulforhopalus sp.]|nr:DNA-binding protein [Desulforhopalus sp.]
MLRRCILFAITLFFATNPAFLPGPAAAMPQTAAAGEAKTVTGTVIDTVNASGYTYMLVATGTTETWVAIPETAVKKGGIVSYYEGMAMANFTSKSLNKTFERIIFSAGLAETAGTVAAAPASGDSFAAALQAEQKSAGPSAPIAEQVSGGSSMAIAPLQEISVPKAEGDNAYTVAEIFAGSKDLAGKKVRLRGKVVKFSPSIMGKNWAHIQDGTGDPLHNTHDLVFTTDATLAVDTIVVMEGILAADKDFGAGYKYAAIVEQATLSK